MIAGSYAETLRTGTRSDEAVNWLKTNSSNRSENWSVIYACHKRDLASVTCMSPVPGSWPLLNMLHDFVAGELSKNVLRMPLLVHGNMRWDDITVPSEELNNCW